MDEPLSVVYRDRWILVVDKPSGMPTQATRQGEPGLFELLKAQEPEVYLHHRLDRPASGLVLFAIHPAANKGIAQGLQQRTIHRGYRAVLSGTARDGQWTTRVDRKKARTRVSVVGSGAGMTAVALELDTGRKHQVRVQAAMAGTPVIGDRRYGGDVGRAWPRLALHAAELRLKHPVTGEPLEVRATIPQDLIALWLRARGN